MKPEVKKKTKVLSLLAIIVALTGSFAYYQYSQRNKFASIDSNPNTMREKVQSMYYHPKTLLVLNLKGCPDCDRVEEPAMEQINKLRHEGVYVVAFDVGALSKKDRNYLKRTVPGVRVGKYIETPSFIVLKPHHDYLTSDAELHGGSKTIVTEFLKDVKYR